MKLALLLVSLLLAMSSSRVSGDKVVFNFGASSLLVRPALSSEGSRRVFARLGFVVRPEGR